MTRKTVKNSSALKMAAETKTEYKLSTELHGHTSDVRAVCAFSTTQGNDYVMTASRDKTACVWKREKTDYILYKKMTHHSGYVSAVCVVYKGDTGDAPSVQK